MHLGALLPADRIQAYFASIARRYDLANHLLSGGMDIFWRGRVARTVRGWEPRDILDLATGTGDLALALQRACPRSSVTAADFCQPMLELAARKGVRQTVLADALDLPFEDRSFDVVTVAFGLRNMTAYRTALHEIARVLRPGGRLLVLDFSTPTGWLRRPYAWYLHRVLPHLAHLVTGRRDAYEYLGASIAAFPHGEELCGIMRECGFEEASGMPMHGGIVTLYCGRAVSEQRPTSNVQRPTSKA